MSQGTAPNNARESGDSPDSMTPARGSGDRQSGELLGDPLPGTHITPVMTPVHNQSLREVGHFATASRDLTPGPSETTPTTPAGLSPRVNNTSAVSSAESVSTQALIWNRNLCADLLRLRQNASLHNSGNSANPSQEAGPTPGSADSISGLTESTATPENPSPGFSRATTGLASALNATFCSQRAT